MNGIVIYKSKYGATQQYAEWIGQELEFPVFATNELHQEELRNSDLVLLGSSVYVGRLMIRKWLIQNLDSLMNKKIFLFVVCGTPAEKKDQLYIYVDSSVPEEIKDKKRTYFLPGKLILKELSWLDRQVLKMGARLLKSREAKSEMLKEYNDVKKENIV